MIAGHHGRDKKGQRWCIFSTSTATFIYEGVVQQQDGEVIGVCAQQSPEPVIPGQLRDTTDLLPSVRNNHCLDHLAFRSPERVYDNR